MSDGQPHSNATHLDASYSDAYKAAGVDVTAGYRAVDLMRRHVERTRLPGVLGAVGGFGGLYDIGGGKALAAGCDGVGTKLKLAFLTDKHDTVGIDLVAMSVNDVVCTGARPLFFLDYIASGRTVPERVEEIVKGVAEGCVQAGCALLGGETAEMPGFYQEGEYDLAGFAVGMADKASLPDVSGMKAGDAVIALPSSGVHSNGFSLIRRIYPEGVLKADPALANTLLTPTRIYVKPVLAALDALGLAVRSIAHITGGGFHENLPRALAQGFSVRVRKASLRTPPIFQKIQKDGGVSEHDMFNTFNMGVGMALFVDAGQADKALSVLKAQGVDAYALGEAVPGDGTVAFV